MGKTRLAITAFVVAVLFVSVIAGTILYYNGQTSDTNSKMPLPTSVPTTTPSPTGLVATLNIVDMENNAELMQMFPELNPTYFYDCLWINGNVTNTGKETAYNAGLRVVAGGVYGTLIINMTVPLSGGAFGTNNATNAFVLGHYRLGTYTKFEASPWKVDHIGSLELGSLNGGQTANVTLAIFHEGTVTSWNVTPVWTNSP
jgi:hypothetical protein